LNRSAVEEIEFDHSHISGGISKINTADNVFGIFTSRQMRERGRYQIQCMKSRSSTGVGQKIDLEYNVETMRITDPGFDESGGFGPPSVPSIMNQIKNRSTDDTSAPSTWTRPQPKEGFSLESTKVPQAEPQSARLKSMLAGLKKEE
jgi:hypothetical protein